MAEFRIRFINGSGPVSRAITWATNSLWDHVEICLDNGYLGAHDRGGVQIRPLDYCSPTRERRYAVPCKPAQYERIMRFAHDQIGCGYNFLDILGLLLKRRKLSTPGRFICSQFVYKAAESGGLNLLNVAPGYEHLVTPETLHLSPLLIGRCVYKAGD